MVACVREVSLRVLLVLVVVKSAVCLNCYQCTGTDSRSPFQCNEYLDDNDLQLESCDSVYGAQYCVKHVGRFEVHGINCFQCTSNTTIDCGDGMIHMGGIKPSNCDHIFEAQYCIKHSGGIGTKRFCSPLDLGNYCDYVKQPGDHLEYRSCVYTCSGEGCNISATIKPVTIWSILSISILTHYMIQSFR